MARPEPLRLPACGDAVPALGRPVPRVRRLEQPRRDRRPRAIAAASRRGPRAGRSAAGGRPPRSRTIGDADVPRLSRRHRRARPRPGRRARARVARPARRRAGDRQVDAPAPGGGRARTRRRSAARVLYATGEESAAQVRLRAGRLGLLDGPAPATASRSSPSTSVGRIVERRPSASARRCSIVDSIQTATVDELDGPAGQRRPGPRVGAPADGARQGRRDRGRPRRPRHEGRHDRRPQDARAPRRRRPQPRGRAASPALRLLRAAKNRFGSTEEVGVFEMGEPGSIEVADPAGRSSVRARRRRRRAASSRRPWRAAGRCSSRSRRWSRPAGYGTPRRTASGLDPNRLALLIAVLGRRAGHRPRQPRRLRQPRRRAARRRARPRPAAGPRARLVAARPADRRRDGRDRRGRPARRAARRSCGLERRLREAARLGFSRAIVPAARGTRPAGAGSIAGIVHRVARRCRDAIAAALDSRASVLVARRPCPAMLG